MARTQPTLLPVAVTARQLGVSLSTVWRMIRRGALPSVRKGGRRMVSARALRAGVGPADDGTNRVPPTTREHPMFRLVGIGDSGGAAPGARDKHALLDE